MGYAAAAGSLPGRVTLPELAGKKLPRDAGALTLEALRVPFACWRISRAGGEFRAVRRTPLFSPGVVAGPRTLLRDSLNAASLEGIALRLCVQDWLAQLSPAELRRTWLALNGADL